MGSNRQTAGEHREPTIYDVVELPESEQTKECPLNVGEGRNVRVCGNTAEYVFVFEASVKTDDERRRNCLACEDCKPGVTARV